MSYEENYFEYISKGCENAEYTIGNSRMNAQFFFSELVSLTMKTQKDKGRIFFVGNGASAAFCNHMALDWSKNGGVLSLSLSDSALMTALSNDYSYEDAFVEFLKINRCGSGDLVATVSSSGNSPNVVNVLEYCKEENINSVGFSGLKPGNQSTQLARYSLYVPLKTYGMVECVHQVFLHLWLDKYMNIYEWDREEVQNMNIKSFKL